MKIFGMLYAQAGDDDQPIVYIPADGTKAEFATFNQVPPDVQAVLSSQSDALGLVALGVVVDLS
jgi:hypothetical protein